MTFLAGLAVGVVLGAYGLYVYLIYKILWRN